jgi:hypothetical protein
VANGCTILRPDPQVLFNQLRDMFSSTVLGGGQVIPESNEWYVVSNDYAMAESFYAIADQMWRETNPETACCDNLYKMAAQNGVFPKPAAHAEGYAILSGVPGTSVPSYFEIQTTLGTFVSVGTVPLTLPADGVIIVRIRALTPGAVQNSAGTVTTGTLTTPAPGINADVQICGGRFCGGADAEDCETFRTRYLQRLSYQPRATMSWIKQKLLEFPCLTRVCVREGSCCRCNAECSECGCKNCGNMMNFYVFFDDAFYCGIPPIHVARDVESWLFGANQGYGEGQVEIGVCGKIFVPSPLVVDVVIDIEGCPSTTQKQLISDQIRALFRRICPSMPFRVKQIELIAANVVGTEINVGVRFDILNYDRSRVYVTSCGDLEMECDWIPCLNEIKFTAPDSARPIC